MVGAIDSNKRCGGSRSVSSILYKFFLGGYSISGVRRFSGAGTIDKNTGELLLMMGFRNRKSFDSGGKCERRLERVWC